MSAPAGDRRQGGLALLGALLLTVIAVTIAATVGLRTLRDIAAATRQAEAAGAAELFGQSEVAARALLRRDGLARAFDALDEGWATTTLATRSAAGTAEARLVDPAARFNLNALAFEPAGLAFTGGAAAGGDAAADAQSVERSEGAGDDPAEAASVDTSATQGSDPTAEAPSAPAGQAGRPRVVPRTYRTGTGRDTLYYALADGNGGEAAVADGTDAPADVDATAGHEAEAMAALARIPAMASALGAAAVAATGDGGALTAQQVAVARFALLLAALDIDDGLVAAVLDWLDPDGDTRFPNGAEDDYYTGLERPYRAANRRFASVGELLLVRGVDAAIYAKLAPHVTVLPGIAPINVNTAGERVLMSLAPAIDEGVARQLVNARQVQPFDSIEAFLAHPALASRPVLEAGLAVSSEWFELATTAQVGRAEFGAVSLMVRNNPGDIQVVARARGLFDD